MALNGKPTLVEWLRIFAEAGGFWDLSDYQKSRLNEAADRIEELEASS